MLAMQASSEVEAVDNINGEEAETTDGKEKVVANEGTTIEALPKSLGLVPGCCEALKPAPKESRCKVLECKSPPVPAKKEMTGEVDNCGEAKEDIRTFVCTRLRLARAVKLPWSLGL